MYLWFQNFFFDPVYNALVFLIAYFPWMDVGIAVVLLTILVKIILFPITRKSIKMQMKIKEIEPELEKIKEKYKDDKEKQARETMLLYQKADINPFSSLLLILIQIPVFLALYFVFLNGGLPKINTEILYSFIKIPQNINMNFLGLVNVSEKSLFLAVLAGVTQYLQFKIVMPKQNLEKNKNTFKDDLIRSMQFQMKFIMPIFIFIIAYQFAAAVALYWVTSNIFTIGQELFVRKYK